MGHFERSIGIALDKTTGEIRDAEELFKDTKTGFQTRAEYNTKALQLVCCECGQDLVVSSSKYDRLHLKHKPYHEACVLADGRLSPKEQTTFADILKSKESPRHKELKTKIGRLLSGVEGVERASIAVDEKFIIRGEEKRRPDVYCKYGGKELVFEIQLSNLSLAYILSRQRFYRQQGMYLIWILDSFDVHGQETFERDIKYLSPHQNFFSLHEDDQTLLLNCDYKFPFLTAKNELHSKWQRKTVGLHQLQFDSESYEAYYYAFQSEEAALEERQKEQAIRIEEAEKTRLRVERLEVARREADEVIAEIKEFQDRRALSFRLVSERINALDEGALEILNVKLGFASGKKYPVPPVIQWFRRVDSSNKVHQLTFLEFILNCLAIQIDVNARDVDGKTAFQELFANSNVPSHWTAKALFKRGYVLTDEDTKAVASLYVVRDDDLILFQLYNRLEDRQLVDSVFTHSKPLFVIESARRKEIVGFKYKANEWVAFANNAIHNYGSYWRYIELAFRKYSLWERLESNDKKGTFQKKLCAFYTNLPKQEFDFDDVFQDLFPELI